MTPHCGRRRRLTQVRTARGVNAGGFGERTGELKLQIRTTFAPLSMLLGLGGRGV